MPKVLISFQTHVYNWQLHWAFNALRKGLSDGFDAIVMLHLAPGAPVPARLSGVPHIVVRTPEIRPARYGSKSGLNDPKWSLWGGGHVDLLLLRLAELRPEYDYYWTCEYDVRFSGRWTKFFDRYSGSDADLIGANIRTAVDTPDWHYWSTLKVPDGVARPTGADLICAFIPVYRTSARLLRAVDQAYEAGWDGHAELTWTTIANHLGMSIEDLGGEGAFVRPANRGQVYTSNLASWELSPGTFAFKPLKHVTLQRDMLWHPVKPIGPTLREDWGRVRKRAKRLSGRLRALLSGESSAQV